MDWEVNLSLNTGARIEVPQVPFLIGRSPECHFRLNRKSIASKHCQIILGERLVGVEEEEEEEIEVVEPTLCIVQLSKDVRTVLNREVLVPFKQAFLLFGQEHVLVLGKEELSLVVHQKETCSRRGPYRNRRSPGSMAINRGGRRKSRYPDEFDDTLRERKR